MKVRPIFYHYVDLLQNRVSETYVKDAIQVIDVKVKKEIDILRKRDEKGQQKLFEKADEKIMIFHKKFLDDITSLRGTLMYTEQQVSKKVNPEDFKSVLSQVKEVKYGYEKESESMMDHIHKMEDKLAEFNRRFSVVESFTTNAQGKLYADINSKGEEEDKNLNAESSIKFKLIDDRIQNLNANYESLKEEVDRKADKSELYKVENTKVSKEELLSLLPNEDSRDILKEEFRSEIAYFNKTIDELARAWDLKLVKLRKDLDLYSLQKDIHKRPLKEDIDVKFVDMHNRYIKMENIIAKFSFEIDHIRDFVKHTGKVMKEFQETNQGALIGKQNIN